MYKFIKLTFPGTYLIRSSINHSLQYCNTAQCKLCRLQQLDTNSNFYSNLAYIIYSMDGPGSCKTMFCIYMISCKACNIT